MSTPVEDLLTTGRAALREGDGQRARAAFEQAAAITASGAALEGLARALYLEQDYVRSVETAERAYAAYRSEQDALGASKVARMLAYFNGTIVGDAAVMKGWQARAQTLLGPEESAEAGWVSLNLGQFEPDRAIKEDRFKVALEMARRFKDTDLEFTALAYLGASIVHSDKIEEGMLMLDEACAAIIGREVEDFQALEEIFCQLFSACEHAHDVVRADQWIRVGEDVAARRNLPAVSAFCRTHYGAILTSAGRWDEAGITLTEAVRLWTLGHGVLKAGALIRLADLRARQGRFEEAEQLLDGFEMWTEAAHPLASIHLARNEPDRAIDVVERAVASMDGWSTATAPLWALLVEIHLSRDDIEAASHAVEKLIALAQRHRSEYLTALSALARGRLCLASGGGDARACLRDALSGFARAQMPMELARTRLELAATMTERSPEVAIAEARAALEAFQKLQAARDADAASALLRKLGVARTGPRNVGPLTKREAEVLELLGHGLSNPEISDRLYISRKTVEHHVGNVLAKLGLRSRAEAAAYAARKDPAGT